LVDDPPEVARFGYGGSDWSGSAVASARADACLGSLDSLSQAPPDGLFVSLRKRSLAVLLNKELVTCNS